MSDPCPLCQSALEHRVGRGTELRRYPRERMVCPHDQKRWHLKLEAVQREIELCKDTNHITHLQAECEDMLLQHMGNAVQLEALETA